MPFAIGGNQLDTGYEVSNSLRFNADDDAKLERSTSGTLSKQVTFSIWIKRSNLSPSGRQIFCMMGDGSGDVIVLEFNNDRFAAIFDGAGNFFPKTDRLFRDVSAWYHLMLVVDTTQSSASNRAKFYVNGVQETSLSGTNPPQNHQADMDLCRIGFNPNDEFDGYMAEFHCLDGQALDPTSFGEFNDNGVWIPKKYTGGNYGTFGFYLEFKQTGTSANSSGIGADTSGNDNHFTPTNLAATDITTDTCTNNFITMNPLTTNSRGTFSQGNCEISTNVAGSSPFGQVEFGTFAVNKGKWYFEAKLISAGSGGKMGIGINEKWETNKYTNGHNNIGSSGNAFYSNQGDIKVGTGSDQSASSYSNDDVIGVAFDLDNSKVYFHKEGVYQRSGDPANGTGGDTLTSSFNDYWTVWVTKDDTNHNTNVKFNFGNAPYSISSGNSDSEGFGNFEYAVPNGYFALCTKNLAEYG